MGNQPSSPQQPSPVPQATPMTIPPLPPPCDMECQKQKNLALLKSALDTADENKEQDPAAYEKARIAYYTLLKGQGWLQSEKQRIAKQDVEPLLQSYTTKYNALKSERQSQKVFVNLQSLLKSQEESDLADNSFFKQQLEQEKSQTDVLNRLNSLQSGSTSSFSVFRYIPILVDFVIFLLALVVMYLMFRKFSRLQSLLGMGAASQTTT
jgi:hypothetical protein